VISHAGAGTVLAALAAVVPLVPRCLRLKDTVMAATGTLKGRGVGLQSVGAQDGVNKIVVGVNTPVPGTSTRKYISAPLDVAQGDPTCVEGSFSLTQCGTIYATDFGEGGTQYLVDLNGGSTVFGDSGAPSWRTSPFGPLGQGTHVGSLSNGLRVELNIYAVMFFNELALNTPWDP
jgi:hypothetical protein